MKQKKEPILVVDDDHEVLRALDAELKDYYEVTTVMNAEQALGTLQNQAFSAIVSDVKMPGIDGLSLIKQCAVRYPDMVRVIITAFEDEEVQETALGPHGAYKFIKPWRNDLIVTLQNALKQRKSKLELQRSLDLKSEILDIDLRIHSNLTPDEVVSIAAQEMLRLPEVVAAMIYNFDDKGQPMEGIAVSQHSSKETPMLHQRRFSAVPHGDIFYYSIPIGSWPAPPAAISLTLTKTSNDTIRYLDFIGRLAHRTMLTCKAKSSPENGADTTTPPKTSGQSERCGDITADAVATELSTQITVIISAADCLREMSKDMNDKKNLSPEEMEAVTLDMESVANDLTTLLDAIKT